MTLAATTITAIFAGQCDADLDALGIAIRERKLALGKNRATGIKQGDTIRFLAPLRPTYIRGLTAKVKRINDKSVVVDFANDPAYGRFSGSHGVRVPITCVQLVKQ